LKKLRPAKQKKRPPVGPEALSLSYYPPYLNELERKRVILAPKRKGLLQPVAVVWLFLVIAIPWRTCVSWVLAEQQQTWGDDHMRANRVRNFESTAFNNPIASQCPFRGRPGPLLI